MELLTHTRSDGLFPASTLHLPAGRRSRAGAAPLPSALRLGSGGCRSTRFPGPAMCAVAGRVVFYVVSYPTTGPTLHAALAEIKAQRGQLDRARTHLESASRLLGDDFVYWTLSRGAAAAEVALAGGHPQELREILDPDVELPPVYPAYLMPLHVLALRAEAALAGQARAAGDVAAEGEATRRAQALLRRGRELITPETWPLGSAPKETLLELELCELEALRAAAEDRAEAWSALAAGWERLGRPLRGAYARLREAQSALGEDLPRDRARDALRSAQATARRLGAQPLLEEIELD